MRPRTGWEDGLRAPASSSGALRELIQPGVWADATTLRHLIVMAAGLSFDHGSSGLPRWGAFGVDHSTTVSSPSMPASKWPLILQMT